MPHLPLRPVGRLQAPQTAATAPRRQARRRIHPDDPLADALDQHGFPVVRFDNRDSGRSTHCADLSTYDLRDMADVAVAVLDALG